LAPQKNSSRANDIMSILVTSPCVRHVSMCSSAVTWQVVYLKFEVRVTCMALNDLIAKIYRCLHEMYMTFGTNTKTPFGCLLSTILSLTKNQSCFVHNKSVEKMYPFTFLALISVCKIYYFNLPSCVARQMAMIHGYSTIVPSCLAC